MIIKELPFGTVKELKNAKSYLNSLVPINSELELNIAESIRVKQANDRSIREEITKRQKTLPSSSTSSSTSPSPKVDKKTQAKGKTMAVKGQEHAFFKFIYLKNIGNSFGSCKMKF